MTGPRTDVLESAPAPRADVPPESELERILALGRECHETIPYEGHLDLRVLVGALKRVWTLVRQRGVPDALRLGTSIAVHESEAPAQSPVDGFQLINQSPMLRRRYDAFYEGHASDASQHAPLESDEAYMESLSYWDACIAGIGARLGDLHRSAGSSKQLAELSRARDDYAVRRAHLLEALGIYSDERMREEAIDYALCGPLRRLDELA